MAAAEWHRPVRQFPTPRSLPVFRPFQHGDYGYSSSYYTPTYASPTTSTTTAAATTTASPPPAPPAPASTTSGPHGAQ
jgi:hypothetical protein